MVEKLSQQLDAEEKSVELVKLPADTYVRLATYTQKLRAATSDEDAQSRLAKKQIWLIEVMTKRLLELRLEKARRNGKPPQHLLPEEESVGNSLADFYKKEERFVKAVRDGQSSFFILLHKAEMQRMVTVRFLKPFGEIIGSDLKRYGPFRLHDVARVPTGNAQLLIANKDAVMVSTSEPLVS